MTSIRCTLLTKRSCALKSWARTMGDQIGAAMQDKRLGAPPLRVWNAPLASGVHDELVVLVAALRGKGQTERGVQGTQAITMHFDGGQASVLIDAEKSAESLAQAVGTWNLKRWQPGFGEWAGDVKKLDESPRPPKVQTYRHRHIIWKIDQNGWGLTLLFNSLCFFAIFCQKQGNECLVCFVYDS